MNYSSSQTLLKLRSVRGTQYMRKPSSDLFKNSDCSKTNCLLFYSKSPSMSQHHWTVHSTSPWAMYVQDKNQTLYLIAGTTSLLDLMHTVRFECLFFYVKTQICKNFRRLFYSSKIRIVLPLKTRAATKEFVKEKK